MGRMKYAALRPFYIDHTFACGLISVDVLLWLESDADLT